VEGTGSYGAGLARHLAGEQVKVVEVNRPDRRQRRTKGKSDPLDAYAAADAVLAGRATTVPKAGDGIARIDPRLAPGPHRRDQVTHRLRQRDEGPGHHRSRQAA
jgi:transposase